MKKPEPLKFFSKKALQGTGHALPLLPQAEGLVANSNLDGYIRDVCEALGARDSGVQEVLRQDLARAYADAWQIANDPALCTRFLALKRVLDLPRPPKSSKHTLHALLKLAYKPKIASGRFCRLKNLWAAGASPAEAYADLLERGSSPKGMSGRFDPVTAGAFGLVDLQAGDTFGLFVWAKVESPNKIGLEIVDRLEWPNRSAVFVSNLASLRPPSE